MPTGTSSNDQIVLTQRVNGDTYDLLGGFDSIRLANVPAGQSNFVRLQNTEAVTGGTGSDRIQILDGTALIASGNGGDDTLELIGTPARVSATDIGTVIGSAGDDVIDYVQYNPAVGPHLVNGGDGFDRLTVSNYGGDPLVLSLRDVEQADLRGVVDVVMNARAYGVTVNSGIGSQVSVRLTDSQGQLKTGNLLGTSGEITVFGSADRDVVRAQAGEEVGRYFLGAGNDRLELVGDGDHSVIVSDVEAVSGGKGADTLQVTGAIPFRMSIDLAGGNDIVDLSGSTGGTVLVSNVERVVGGSADETVVVRTATKGMTLDLGAGYDVVSLSDSANSIKVSGVEVVFGGAGADRITVSAGDTTAATLYGFDGADILTGGSGNDIIIGGRGKDVMTGGAGADRFVFQSVLDSDNDARDIINDFQVGVDKLVFEVQGAQQFDFLGEAAFTANGHAQARFLDATDQLLIDVDGNGTMDMRMTLSGVDGTRLAASDFVWGGGIA